MPVINITMGKNQIGPKEKKQLISTLTSNAAEITKLPPHAFTILIEELDHDSIGVGGQSLAEMLKAK